MSNWIKMDTAPCGCDFAGLLELGACLVGFKSGGASTTIVRKVCQHGEWDAKEYFTDTPGDSGYYDIEKASGPCPSFEDF